MLHAWERYGLAGAQGELVNHYGRQLASGSVPKFHRILRGKLLFLRMVRGPDDHIFVKLAERFNSLLAISGLTDTDALKVVRHVRTANDLKHAVFVVESHLFGPDYNYMQGTAFYVEGIGFVTCEHVLRRDDSVPPVYSNPSSGDVVKVIDASMSFEVEVEIEAVYATEDVAVLKPLTALPSSVIPLRLNRTDPKTGDTLTLAGFPAYSPGKTLTTVSTTAINAYPKFGKRHFEIGQQIRKGNSGGPVLGPDFYVMGVAKEGASQDDGNNAVLAVSELRSLLGL